MRQRMRCLGDEISNLFDHDRSLYASGYAALDGCLPDGAFAFQEIVELRASTPLAVGVARRMVHHTIHTLLSECHAQHTAVTADCSNRSSDVVVHYLTTRPQHLNITPLLHRLLSDGVLSAASCQHLAAQDDPPRPSSPMASSTTASPQPLLLSSTTLGGEAEGVLEHAAALADAAAHCIRVYRTDHIGDVLHVLRGIAAAHQADAGRGPSCEKKDATSMDEGGCGSGDLKKKRRVEGSGGASPAAPRDAGLSSGVKTCLVVIDNLVDIFAEDSLQYPKGNSVASSFIQADLARSLRIVSSLSPRSAVLLINALVPLPMRSSSGGGVSVQQRRCHGGTTWQSVADVALSVGDGADEQHLQASGVPKCCVRVVQGGPQGHCAFLDV